MDARTLLRRNHESGRIVTATVSGVLTTKEEMIRLFDEHVPSVDIITTKSVQVVPTPGNREPVICSPAPGDFGNSVGLRNPGMEEALAELKRLRGRGLRAFLNVSLAADSPENFITLVKAFDPLADLLELNFSCPHAAAGFGASIGSDKATAAEYVRRIQEAYPERKSPLIIKLTPNADDIAGIAKAVIEAGADGIAAINTVGPKLYIEPHSGAPILNNKLGGKGGASGEWVKDDAIRCIKAIRNAIGDDPIILGMGGVSSYDDARRMIEAGADSVGVGSALSRVMPSDYENFFHALKTGGDTSPYLSSGNAMEYTPHKVLTKEMHGDDVMVITVSGEVGCNPGEFVFIWVPGMGEKPFSVAVNKPLTFLIKKRGIFTSAFFGIEPGDTIYTRGLYGRPMAYEKTERALLIGGGTGAAVLPLIAEKLSADGTRMDIRVGVVRKEGKDPLEDVLSSYGSYMSVPDDGKPGRVLDSIVPSDLAGDTALYVVGPGKMMEKAAEKAEAMGFPADRIYLSLEKKTMCGIGMCGECVCGGHLPCKEGTFFTWKTLKENGAVL